MWIPSWADHVIVNADEGDVQTGELVLEGGIRGLLLRMERMRSFYGSADEGGYSEYVEKFVVRVKVDESWKEPCLWALVGAGWEECV